MLSTEPECVSHPGTPPNLILVGFLTSQFPEHSLNFGSWMAFALPEVFTLAFYQSFYRKDKYVPVCCIFVI